MKLFIDTFIQDTIKSLQEISPNRLEDIVHQIDLLKRRQGRLFFLGMGGSAANCSHAVNDFRKLCNIECYTPTDNVSEFSARVNDDSLERTFIQWLKVSRFASTDALFILSVGGGDKQLGISSNIVAAVDYAAQLNALILGIVGRDGGHTAKKSDTIIRISTSHSPYITPITEGLQSVLLHLLVGHPKLQENRAKWESI